MGKSLYNVEEKHPVSCRNLSCPAVSLNEQNFMRRKAENSYHNCNRTVRSSKYIVLERKSIPIVAYEIQIRIRLFKSIRTHMISIIETVVHKTSDDRCFSN